MVLPRSFAMGARRAGGLGLSRWQQAAKAQLSPVVGMGSARWMGTTKFLESHEYCKVEGDTATVGITKFAAEALGDVVFVELPEVGDEFEKGSSFGSIESVKAASDVYAPMSGAVTEVNEALRDSPDLVNSSPMGDGWIMKLKISDPSEADSMLDEAAYNAHISKD